jgi:hypothetical protein
MDEEGGMQGKGGDGAGHHSLDLTEEEVRRRTRPVSDAWPLDPADDDEEVAVPVGATRAPGRSHQGTKVCGHADGDDKGESLLSTSVHCLPATGTRRRIWRRREGGLRRGGRRWASGEGVGEC